jgi:hypothetical protein
VKDAHGNSIVSSEKKQYMAESVRKTDPLKMGRPIHSVQKNRYDALAYGYVLMNSSVRPEKKRCDALT